MQLNNKQAAREIHEQLLTEYTEIRISQEVSQAGLSRKSGVGQNLISRIENRKTSPMLRTFIRLLLPLGKTLTITTISNNLK